jgi:hypothetical protein
VHRDGLQGRARDWGRPDRAVDTFARGPLNALTWKSAPAYSRRSERGRADASRNARAGYGGAGFLSSHLCECLLAEGAVVLCVDIFFTGARRHIEHLIRTYLKIADCSRSDINVE